MSDLIKRADAIEAVWKLDKDANEYVVDDAKEIHGYCTAIGVCVGELSALPSAEAEQVTGKLKNSCDSLLKSDSDECKEQKSKLESAEAVQGEWTDIDDYYRMATCSRCHKVTMFEKWGEYTKPYDFCPNCGARMIKGGDDE